MLSACPCKGCKDREMGCHGKCEKYKAWDKENTKLRNESFIQRIVEFRDKGKPNGNF